MSEIQPGNQTVENPEIDPETEALFESFGMPRQPQEKKDIEFPQTEEPSEPTSEDDDPKKPDEESSVEQRNLKIVYNDEEKELTEEEARTLAQKGMNYDKVQGRVSEYQKSLDRAARLAGYKDHQEFIANLDKLEKAQEERQQTELDELKNGLLDEIEAAGIDREQAEKYIEQHPLFQEGKRALEERQKLAKQTSESSKWQPLYQAYPELAEAVQKANGQPVEWYTSELAALIEKGNDPLIAYEWLNRDKVQQKTQKQAEQKIIKQQQLGNRGHAEGQEPENNDPILSPFQMSLAEEFGVSTKGVIAQQKLLNNRR